jgi:hypothetical protein
MEHPLTTRIRLYLICIAVACISWSHPELGMILLGTGFGWWKGCGCCGGGGPTCNGCSTTSHTQYQVFIAGISNSTDCSDCSQYNGTWTLTSSNDFCSIFGICPPTICHWSYIINPCFCVGSNANTQQAEQRNAVNQIYMQVLSSVVRVIFSGNQIGSDCHSLSTIWSSYFFWQNSFSSGTLNCGGLSSYSVAYLSQASSGCTSDTTAALVTAI